jgi:inorganic pyrophosphatase
MESKKMDISKVSAGNIPEEFNVIIEISASSDPVKYEFDKEAGAIVVDRFLRTSMQYPCNYGFIPHTLSGDGDPADVLVITNFPIIPGAIIAVRPIGVLKMEDESGEDEKIIAVPTTKLDPLYKDINSYEDLPSIIIDRICHFFERYKDLDAGKWVKIKGMASKEEAKKMIMEAVARHKEAA